MIHPVPFVSIIMPVRNEADFIMQSLKAVLNQNYPHDYMEVLIADGMSTDTTRDQIHQVAVLYPDIAVRILDNPKKIVPSGLNIAVQIATGEIIIRVDGHCVIAGDYVSRCVAHLLNDGVDAVGGPIEAMGDTPLSMTIAIAMSSVFGVGNLAFRTVKDQSMLVDTVAFPAYTKAMIVQAGPFDEELVRNQDDEYNYRLRKLGAKILLSPDIHALYYSRNSLRSLWQQYFQYGYWKVRGMQKHPAQMSPRQFVPPIFVAALLGGAILTPFSKPMRRLWAITLSLYVAANLTASLWLAVRKGWQHVDRLPIIFAVLHVSYGLGFLLGLVKFANRWQDHE